MSANATWMRLRTRNEVDRIDIVDSTELVIGSLRLLQREDATDWGLMNRLARWRTTARHAFFNQVIVSAETTQRWLSEQVLSDPARGLFMIMVNNRPIGHIGFKELTESSAELDNLVRGEMGGGPSLILFAERALVRWLFETLELREVYCNNLLSNQRVIELHRNAGFSDAEVTPLFRRITEQGPVLEPLSIAGRVPDDHIQTMRLTLTNYYAKRDNHT